ncbi:MAG TPA: single-stranded DNA-binding protein [Syntrophorhabdaceae bacterium]|nr:single-stranded DNA-binding protein [Syntrophorhabdaceae bacterium]HRR72735.1 single-stranded DNA-binding protein [Syntrophorhabdaceae bacterium]
MNILIVSGNLGADPEPIYTDTGIHMANFPVSVKAGKKSFWLHVSCFEKLADIAERHLHKGAKVIITGILTQDKWVNDDNQVRTSHKLIANRIDFIHTDGRGFDKDSAAQDDVFVSE